MRASGLRSKTLTSVVEETATIPSNEERIKAALVMKRANISRRFLAVVLYWVVLSIVLSPLDYGDRYMKVVEPKRKQTVQSTYNFETLAAQFTSNKHSSPCS